MKTALTTLVLAIACLWHSPIVIAGDTKPFTIQAKIYRQSVKPPSKKRKLIKDISYRYATDNKASSKKLTPATVGEAVTLTGFDTLSPKASLTFTISAQGKTKSIKGTFDQGKENPSNASEALAQGEQGQRDVRPLMGRGIQNMQRAMEVNDDGHGAVQSFDGELKKFSGTKFSFETDKAKYILEIRVK